MKGAYPGSVPDDWQITPWTHDWYEKDDWAQLSGDNFHKWVHARRYGGDLQGVIDKLDYLEDLGINAIYFNPINDSPSLHKYDARSYRHIDIHFGPEPINDASIIASEDPLDPNTWKWTSADRLFLDLIKQAHQRGIRVIVDYSWNHTGITFWAWKDLVKNQSRSRYKNWYDIESFDDPSTPDINEFKYHGWLGVSTLPELKKVDVRNKRDGYPFEGNLHPEVKNHVFNVTRRWMDPDGDGDPSDGVDGFRLDVAHHVPMGFWREYRKFTRNINPEVFLLGEAWWTKWPDHLMDPRPFLSGDIFDSVMHYQWYKPARRFFAKANNGYLPSELVTELNRIYDGYPSATSQSLMNLTASHDSPRFSTSFQNKNKYKFAVGARGNKSLVLTSPDDRTRHQMRMMLLHQFTFISAPHIWNGDELGMWGADDPDCRKPVIWPEFSHSPEKFLPDGSTKFPVQVKPDLELLAYYKSLIQLRKGRRELVHGTHRFLLADDKNLTFVYSRSYNNDHAIVAFNNSSSPAHITVPASDLPQVAFSLHMESIPGSASGISLNKDGFQVFLQPESGAIFTSLP